MKEQSEPVVLERENVIKGTDYPLSSLPDGINFKYSGNLYRTITYPRYNLSYMNDNSGKTRPCLNLQTLKDEAVAYCVIVKVV